MRECRLQCASGQLGVFSNVEQRHALLSLVGESVTGALHGQSLNVLIALFTRLTRELIDRPRT